MNQRSDSNLLQPKSLEILVRGVVKLREAGGVVGVAFRDADDHALARTSEKHSICIQLIRTAFCNVDVLPAIAPKVEVLPAVVGGVVTEVPVPNKASPIEFKPLDIEFCGNIFQE